MGSGEVEGSIREEVRHLYAFVWVGEVLVWNDFISFGD